MVETIAHLMLKTGLDNYVATHDWVWPVCEILHFFGMAAIIGTVGLVDARMLGIGKGIPIASLERFVPIGVLGLLLNMITGFIFVAGNPVGGPQEYLTNLAFLIKMSLIAIAGVNLLVFYALGIATRRERDRARRLRAAQRKNGGGRVAGRLVRRDLLRPVHHVQRHAAERSGTLA